jgi:hypothetical protein
MQVISRHCINQDIVLYQHDCDQTPTNQFDYAGLCDMIDYWKCMLYSNYGARPGHSIFLDFTTLNDLEIDQLDFVTAFHNSPLKEDIYIRVRGEHKTEYYKLLKSIYGLIQAPYDWQVMIRTWLFDHGFVVSDWEQCLFYNSTDTLWVIVWVDDTLTVGPRASVNKFNIAIASAFKVTLGGPATFFLSIEIVRDRVLRTTVLRQPQKIDEMLATFHMQDCTPTDTPGVPTSGSGGVKTSTTSNLLLD